MTLTHLDSVHERLDVVQTRSAGLAISDWSARDLCADGDQSLSGEKLHEIYGLLYHWTASGCVESIRENGLAPGRESGGVFLTPSRYSPCMAPYRLGLASPRDVCLGVDVSQVANIWGPGTAWQTVPVWQGGGLEFYCTETIAWAQVKTVHGYDICGDPQWARSTT